MKLFETVRHQGLESDIADKTSKDLKRKRIACAVAVFNRD